METLGGNLPPGRAAAVFAGGRTQVFAIAAGGAISRWSSANGIDWQGPADLMRLNTNIVPSFLCAIAAGSAVHVFAINNGGPFSSGGPLVRWTALDGTNFLPPVADGAWPIPGGANGIAASAPGGGRIDAFAPTANGLIRYSWNSALTSLGSAPLPGSLGLPRSVPAAVSSGPNVTDVFAVAADGNVLRWRTTNGVTWTQSVLPRPANAPAGALVGSGLTAISPAPNRVELFSVTRYGQMANWSFDGAAVSVQVLPAGTVSLNDSVPAAMVVDGHLEVFAIGQPPNPFTGGPLVRWRRGSGNWSDFKPIGASLSAGGLGGAAAGSRIDVFGLAGNGLQHWPAGIAAAGNEGWTNWAGSQQSNPIKHCHPASEEEVVAVVRTAERLPDARVRAVGSGWSFPDIAVTQGVLVETNALNSVMTHVIDRAVLTESAPDPKYLIHVEAGIQVERLMLYLDFLNLGPFTMGGSSGQTIAGVISTSVHGSDWDRGPIPNAVRAIQLVGPGGTRHWIEPDQWRITNEAALRPRLGSDVRIRYDDDWFDAALVSVGSLGIVTGYVLEATDQYYREKTCEELRWSALKPQLVSGALFAEPHHYVMIAIDPVETGDRTCYVTRQRRSDGPPTAASGSFDPLGAYCQIDIENVLQYLASAPLAAPVLEGLLSVVTATAGAFGIPLPAGTTLVVAIPILVAALKASGPGAVGDFLGRILNQSSELGAALATYMTRDALKPGQVFQGIAHRVMAPPNPGECAARGLALEVAFDATSPSLVAYVEEAMMTLDQRRAQGLVLGGWISLRFVGPSRAILSPQQFARTCMIEIVGLRALNGTAPLLDELEKMATRHGGIQHWGMFGIPNLAAASLPRAYPRLDSWRRVRREITSNGTVRTFENGFSGRLGLDAAPGGTPLLRQAEWRWCQKCLGMAYAGGAPGPCPAGGTHDHNASGNYAFPHNAPWNPGQRDWRWCRKCMGMTLAGTAAPCPAGGNHDLTASSEYIALRNYQANWRWCRKCQSLAFGGGAPGPCAAGGTHDHSASGNYWLGFANQTLPPPVLIERPLRPGGLGGPGGIGGLGGGLGVPIPDRGIARLRVEQPVSTLEQPGERGWRWCSRCQGFSRAGGSCVGGVPHAHDGSGAYLVARNAPTAPGQAHWRLCRKCQTLAFRAGACFAGGTHDLAGSGDYTVRENAGQNQWRHCRNCQGLWFSGNGGQGRCPAPGGVHDTGPDDYVV